MPREHDPSAELRLKRIEALTSIVGALGVMATIWFGFHQLAGETKAQADAVEEQTRIITNQWSQRFYDEKLAIYSRATQAAARVAAVKLEGGDIRDAKTQFKVLYWGPMCITEGIEVERAMVFFGTAVDADADAATLEQLSLRLGHICKNEAHLLYSVPQQLDPVYGSSEDLLTDMSNLVENLTIKNSKKVSQGENAKSGFVDPIRRR